MKRFLLYLTRLTILEVLQRLYSLGLMDENIWEAKLKFMLASFSSCIGRQVFNQRRESLDQRIVELIISVPAANCE